VRCKVIQKSVKYDLLLLSFYGRDLNPGVAKLFVKSPARITTEYRLKNAWMKELNI
jgi:hypothetical protein